MCCLLSNYFPLTAVSFILWFISSGLLTVLWALAIGLLGMRLAQTHASSFICYYYCFINLSAPLSLSLSPLSHHTTCKLQNTKLESSSEYIPWGISCSMAQLQWAVACLEFYKVSKTSLDLFFHNCIKSSTCYYAFLVFRLQLSVFTKSTI